MTPVTSTPPTQQDLDALERIGKIVGSVAILSGTFAGLARWLRKRHEVKEARYAARIERIVRASFATELSGMDGACRQIGHIEHLVTDNTRAIGDMQRDTVRLMAEGDIILDQLLTLVRDNRDWLDDLQTFTDHAHGIDRRSSIGEDRRKRIDDHFDSIQERRQERRRTMDTLRNDFDRTRERERRIDSSGEVE